MIHSQNQITSTEDSMDVFQILKKIYVNRRVIGIITLSSFLMGVIIALSIENAYTARTIFVPQANGNSRPSSTLSGIASLAGINLGTSPSTSNILPPTLYPQILGSTEFKRSLLRSKLILNSDSIRLSEYFTLNQEKEYFDFLKRYTLDLPRTILGSFNSEHKRPSILKSERLFNEITELEQALYKTLDSRLVLNLNQQEGFVVLEYTDKDKYIAAQIIENAKNLLQQAIISFKIQSANEVLNFANKQYKENKILFESLQDSIALFKDKNINISSSLYKNRLNRLERDLAVLSSVDEQLASQVEQAKLEVSKNTPVFTVIEPVTIPFQRSYPKRTLITTVWTLIGFILSISFVLLKSPIRLFIERLRD